MSYITRRAFHLALLALAVPLCLSLVLDKALVHGQWQFGIFGVLLGMILVLLTTSGALVTILFYFLQAREQLMGLRARMMPKGRTAHLIAIGILFAGITIAISATTWEKPISQEPSKAEPHGYWEPGVSPVGATVVVFTFMILAGYAVYNPWLLPVLATMLILTVRRHPYVWNTITEMAFWLPEGYRGTGAWLVVHRLEVSNALYLRAVVFLLDLIALHGLVRLAKPKLAQRGVLNAAVLRILDRVSNIQSTRAITTPAHEPMTSMLSRGRHRRFAVHGHKSPWVLAGALAVLYTGLLWLEGVNAPENSKVCMVIVMLTIVPGAVVATGWRERWPALGFESLFPSARGEFVKEIAVGLLADLAEFWVTAAVASIAVLAVFTPQLLLSRFAAASIVASLMMQVLWFGAIFLSSRFRQLVPYALLLAAVGISILIPIFEFWQDHTLFGPPILLVVALIEMSCGVGFALTGLDLWRRADLA
jgi:hypothetical protein